MPFQIVFFDFARKGSQHWVRKNACLQLLASKNGPKKHPRRNFDFLSILHRFGLSFRCFFHDFWCRCRHLFRWFGAGPTSWTPERSNASVRILPSRTDHAGFVFAHTLWAFCIHLLHLHTYIHTYIHISIYTFTYMLVQKLCFFQIMVLVHRSPPIPKPHPFDLDLPISLGCGGRAPRIQWLLASLFR